LVSAYLNHQKLILRILHKQPKQIQVVSSKSLDHPDYVPPVNHPWRTYGRKINGTPIPIDGL